MIDDSYFIRLALEIRLLIVFSQLLRYVSIPIYVLIHDKYQMVLT